MASSHDDHALESVVMVSIILEAHRHHRQLRRRVSHLDPLRQLLIRTCVEHLTSDRVSVPDMVALMRETLDGTDTSVRKTITAVRQLGQHQHAVRERATSAQRSTVPSPLRR